MNTEKIIQNSRNESNQLVLKLFKMVPIFTVADLILIMMIKRTLTINELPIASAMLISLIPILYYKYSKERK